MGRPKEVQIHNMSEAEHCCLGSSITFERSRVLKGLADRPCENDNLGFNCLGCGRYSCYHCVQNIMQRIQTKMPRVCLNNETVVEVKKFLSGQGVPKVCHACWISREKKSMKERKKMFIANSRKPMSFDGVLVFPEFNFGADSPMLGKRCVDVHGLGEDEEVGLSGPWHYVPSVVSCNNCSHLKASVFPMIDQGNIRRLAPQSVALPTGEEFLVQVILINQVKTFSSTKKGDNSLTAEEAAELNVFSITDRNGEDVTIVVGLWREKEHASLLLCRFYDVWQQIPLNNNGIVQLYEEVSKRTEHSDLVRKRTGGSSGRFEGVTEELLVLISQDTSCPKKGLGQWWIPGPNSLFLCYINEDCEAKSVEYSTPKWGGQFIVDPNMMLRFPFLFDFALCKIRAARLLDWFNANKAWGDNIVVTQKAVDAELYNFQMSEELAAIIVQQKQESLLSEAWNGTRKDGACSSSSSPLYRRSKIPREVRVQHLTYEKMVLANYANYNMHTKVQHPVGAHQDSFGKSKEEDDPDFKFKIYSLENKICFHHPRLFDRYGIGRGGAGPGKFVFAILDWQSSQSGARRRAVRNNLPADQVPARISRDFWEQFRVAHPDAANAVDQRYRRNN